MKKIDPYTKEEFIPKRKNQVFASEKNKSDYHNEQAAILREKRAKIDKKINNNHRILLQLLEKENTVEINENILKGKGYSFEVYNHYVKHEDRYVNAIYEFIVFKVKNSNNIKIIRDERF